MCRIETLETIGVGALKIQVAARQKANCYTKHIDSIIRLLRKHKCMKIFFLFQKLSQNGMCIKKENFEVLKFY